MANEKPICEATHPQILSGRCPWCETQIGTSEGESASGERRTQWNLAALKSALLSDDVAARQLAVTNLMNDEGPGAESVVPLLSIALSDASDSIRGLTETALDRLGNKLTTDQAKQFEAQLPGGDDELVIRILLLGYYFLGQQGSPAARERRQRHILWLIEHAPEIETAGSPLACVVKQEDKETYQQARQLWQEQIRRQPNNTAVLGNAASFLLLRDRELSEQYYRRAQTLEPRNPKWPDRLGHLYSLHSRSDVSGGGDATRSALRELQMAEDVRQGVPWHANEDPADKPEKDQTSGLMKRMHALCDLAKTAYEAGEFDVAREYAAELLEIAHSERIPKFFREDGQAVYDGNLVLGRCALRDGDLDRAKEHLFAAGRSKGSPTLQSFGPHMSLAKDLLEHGERDAVLQFFELCRAFWEHGAGDLDEWVADVKSGATPDFGANLDY